MTEKLKAIRKLSNIDFSKEGAAISLVGPIVGGAANGKKTLIMKSLSQTAIQKMQQIQVTMEVPDFLQKFFGLWYEDAQVLAALLGYVEPTEDPKEVDPEDSYWKTYVEEKLAAFTVLKSLKDSGNISKALVALSEEDYLKVFETQSQIEPLFSQVEVVKQKLIKENKMPQTIETVEKGLFESVQKQLSDTQTLLEKANSIIAAAEEAKKELIQKSRLDKVTAVVASTELSSVLFKALGLVEKDEDFEAVVKALGDLVAASNASEVFKETGASGEVEETVEESAVAKAVKAQLAANK
jgi:hypothetical protein